MYLNRTEKYGFRCFMRNETLCENVWYFREVKSGISADPWMKQECRVNINAATNEAPEQQYKTLSIYGAWIYCHLLSNPVIQYECPEVISCVTAPDPVACISKRLPA